MKSIISEIIARSLGSRKSSKSKVSCLLVVLLLTGVFVAGIFQPAKAGASSQAGLGQAADTDWWPMFHHDLTHTGISTSTAPSTNHTIWGYTLGGSVFSSPAVVGGLVYVGSEDNNVYCLNASTGTQVWKYTTSGEVWSSPAVAGGEVFISSDDGEVYALNASTGTFVWSYTIGTIQGYHVFSSPAVAGGCVYVGSCDDGVYCLKASSGTLVWNYTTSGEVWSSPAVAGGCVYVGSCDDGVYCLKASSGTLVWNYTTGAVVFSSPAVVGGLVYVGSEDNNVYCLNASTGTQVWKYTTGDAVDCSPAVGGGLVYVGSEDGNLYCLSASNGTMAWKYTTLGQVDCSPAVAGRYVYVGSSDGNFYCLFSSNGTLVWKYTTNLCSYSSPAVAEGMVYFCSEDNNVYCFGSSQTYTYIVNISAHCYTEDAGVSVPITMDGSASGYNTPHTFIGLTGTHTFAVPIADAKSHAFLDWNTGQRTGTITVSSCGAYTAYYVGTSETLIPVPFHYQEKYYYCGPACLQMVFNYYGQNIPQPEIACVARTIGHPLYGTIDSDLRRAAQFSDISTSIGDQLPHNITGYSLRQLGYSAFEAQGMNLTTLESFLDQGKPLILCMWYSSAHYLGHFRVAVGYNQTCVFLQDPWNAQAWGGVYGGPYTVFNDSQFMDLWSYSGNWALYVSPWEVNLSAPAYVNPGKLFEVKSTITYPEPPPNALSEYPASSCNATIALPANLSLTQGELQTKPIGTGLLNASNSATVTWALVANSSVKGTIGIVAEGKISGSVGPVLNYPAYDYTDRIGAAVNFSINFGAPDVTVINVAPSKPAVGQGFNDSIDITVADPGSSTETFNVTLYANATTIATRSVTLTSGDSTTITLTWSTKSFAYGNYTISANVTLPAGEVNRWTGTFTYGTLRVTIPGDANGDGVVDAADFFILERAWGTSIGQKNYDPRADFNGDGVVDAQDFYILEVHWGMSVP